MIALICFFIVSIILIYLLWRINRTPSKGIILLFKFILFLLLGGQFWSIFQYGINTAGVPSRILFFENNIIHTFHLPNPEIQLLSFFFCIATLVCCLPRNIKNGA